jgi:antitoxin MazE
MHVAKWGNSLAVRLPKALVEALGLKAGDELSVVAASKKEIVVAKRDRRAEFLKAMEQFNWPTPEGYKFDRDEANER